MKNINNDQIYYVLKLVCDLLVGATFKTMFLSTKNVTETFRRVFLVVIIFAVMLNTLGVYRNIYTTWKFQDFIDVFWLCGEFYQLGISIFLFVTVLRRETVMAFGCTVLAISCLVFGGLNFYYWIMNFSWLREEGFIIFMFWFVKNLGMVGWYGLVTYLISYRYLNTKSS